jgi:hypothetical protein
MIRLREGEPGFEGGEKYDLGVPDVKLTSEQEERVNDLMLKDPKLSRGEAIRLVLKSTAEQKNE